VERFGEGGPVCDKGGGRAKPIQSLWGKKNEEVQESAPWREKGTKKITGKPKRAPRYKVGASSQRRETVTARTGPTPDKKRREKDHQVTAFSRMKICLMLKKKTVRQLLPKEKTL